MSHVAAATAPAAASQVQVAILFPPQVVQAPAALATAAVIHVNSDPAPFPAAFNSHVATTPLASQA